MSLSAQLAVYFRPPFMVSDATLAARLAAAGRQRLTQTGGASKPTVPYSIANCLHPSAMAADSQTLGAGLPRLELPDWPRLTTFYDEHGLEPLRADEVAATQAADKLRRAWELLATVPAVAASLRDLVETVQVLRSPDPEIDVSYSHPAIPFSVFVSVGEDASPVSSLRVAESLLHEAMHLKLTLLEQEVELVRTGSQAVYYSPWREEDRPVRGVLHGMFVFAAVREFYQILSGYELPESAREFVIGRQEVIAEEMTLLAHFPQVPDLTAAGRQLAVSLIARCAA
jgi:HEXXH motif-containing protein